MVLAPTLSLLSPGGAVFNPSQLPGLAAWYSADFGVLTSVGPDVPATDGQTVRRWLDRSGNGLHMDQSVLAAQLTFSSGYLSMTGVSQSMATANVQFLHPFTVFCVFRSTAAGTAANYIIHQAPASGAGQWGINGQSTSNIRSFFQVRSSSLDVTQFAGLDLNVWQNAVAGSNADDTVFFESLGQAATPSSTGTGIAAMPTLPLNIGRGIANNVLMDVAEIGVVNRTLTEAEKSKLRAYLRRKYGHPGF